MSQKIRPLYFVNIDFEKADESVETKFAEVPLKAKKLPAETKEIWAHVARVGIWNDYPFTIELFDSLVKSFYSETRPRRVLRGHPDMDSFGEEAPAVAWIRALVRDGENLWARYELTSEFEKQIKEGNYLYNSIVFQPAYLDEFGNEVPPYLVSIGATNDPAVDGLMKMAAKKDRKTMATKEKETVETVKTVETKQEATKTEAVANTAETTPSAEQLLINELGSLLGVEPGKLLDFAKELKEKADNKAADKTVLEALELSVKTLTDELEAAKKELSSFKTENQDTLIETQVQAYVQMGKIHVTGRDAWIAACKATNGTEVLVKTFGKLEKTPAETISFKKNENKAEQKTAQTWAEMREEIKKGFIADAKALKG